MKSVDERIVAAKTRTISSPGGTEAYEITIETGSTPLEQSRTKGDITLHVNAEAENRMAAEAREANAARKRAVQEIEMPDSTPTDADIAEVGNVRMVRNKAIGYEYEFQKDKSEFFVFLDGQRVRPSEALGVLFALLRENTKKVTK